VALRGRPDLAILVVNEVERNQVCRFMNGKSKAVTPNEASKTAGVSSHSDKPVARSANRDVADFIEKIKSLTPAAPGQRGRLIFAMDATMSRQPTWDMALAIQSDMFEAVKATGGLDVQLVYFRGAGECRTSKWVSDPDALARLMRSVACQGGYTQIGKVLNHAHSETSKHRVNALVYVGDAFEEDIDAVCGRAGELALLGVPVFLFQEGNDAHTAAGYREIARLTKGAHCRFDAGAARQLRDLIRAVAVYASGGRNALLSLASREKGGAAQRLLEQL
jgi:hypothetical protein